MKLCSCMLALALAVLAACATTPPVGPGPATPASASGLPAPAAGSSAAGVETSADHPAAVMARERALLEAIDQEDLDRVASFFDPAVVFVDSLGAWGEGAEALGRAFEALFAANARRRMLPGGVMAASSGDLAVTMGSVPAEQGYMNVWARAGEWRVVGSYGLLLRGTTPPAGRHSRELRSAADDVRVTFTTYVLGAPQKTASFRYRFGGKWKTVMNLLPGLGAGDPGAGSPRAADAALSSFSGRREVDRFLALLDEGVVFIGGDGKAAVGREAVRESWARFFEPGGPSLLWEPSSEEVAGDLAWTRGTYDLRRPDGTTARGGYVTVWRRQAQGWRALFDSSSDPVPEGAAPRRTPGLRVESADGRLDAALWSFEAPDGTRGTGLTVRRKAGDAWQVLVDVASPPVR